MTTRQRPSKAKVRAAAKASREDLLNLLSPRCDFCTKRGALPFGGTLRDPSSMRWGCREHRPRRIQRPLPPHGTMLREMGRAKYYALVRNA